MNIFVNKIRSVASHPLARGSAIVFSGTMLSNVIAYAYHLIIGRMLGPEKYGELASLFSLSYLLNVPGLVVQNIIAKYVATYSATHEDGKAKTLLLTATKWLTVASVIIVLITIPAYKSISEYLHVESSWYVFYIFIASIVFFLATIITGTLQGYKKFTELMVFGNIGIILRLTGGIIGAFYGVGATAFANMISTILAYILSFLPLRFIRNVKAMPTKLSVKAISEYGIPSLLCILGITSLYSTDVMLVKHYFSAFDAGMYAALAMMGKIIFFAGSSVAYVLFPVVAERKVTGTRSHALVYMSLAIVAGISLILTCGYFIFPALALQLLFGSSYLAASSYLGLFGLFITFYSLSNVLTMALLGLGRTKIWIILFVATLAQIIGVHYFHNTLEHVIYVNLAVCATLFLSLLQYYRHERV